MLPLKSTCLINQILKLQTCYYFAFAGKNKLTKRAFTKDNSNPTFILTIFLTSISTLGLLNIYIDIYLQRATKLALKSFVLAQEHSQVNFAPYNKPLKVRNLDFYYKYLYIEYYYFCQ